MRWWKELRKPALACERLGHVMRDRRVNVILDEEPGETYIFHRYVAVEATEVTPTCARCGHAEEMRIEDLRRLTSFTTSSEQMKKLRRDGRIVV
jgi:hypothetical protein